MSKKPASPAETTQLLSQEFESTGYRTGSSESQEPSESTAFPPNSFDYIAPSTTVKKEITYIVKNSIPVVITFVFQYFIQIMLPIYFSSQLGSNYLSACSLSITTFYISGPVIINGFTTALDTLCSTAFGAGHYQRVGLFYQRSNLILMIVFIPIVTFWLTASHLISLISDDPELVFLCSEYLKLMPFAAPALILFECSKRYIQSQSKFTIPTRITIFALPLTLLLNIYFRNIGMGFYGPPTAFILTAWFMAISIVLYIFFIDGYQCWNYDISMKILFSEWGVFFELGIPGVLMLLSESFAFQILTILSTKFGTDELAAQSVVSTLASFAFNLPFAVAICSATRVANIIGARSKDYKVAINVMISVGCFFSVFNFSWMVIFRYPLASLFSEDAIIVERICKLFLVVGFNQFLDCINIMCAGILRGQGRQRIGSILSLISYYVVASPFEILFGFKFGLKVFGLWLGLAVGVGVLSILELIIVLRSNWEQIIEANSKIA